MKTHRHHNNKGARQVRRGKTYNQLKAMCRRLGLPFVSGKQAPEAKLTTSANES